MDIRACAVVRALVSGRGKRNQQDESAQGQLSILNSTIDRSKEEEGRRSRSHAELTRSRSPKDPFVQLLQGLSQPFMLRRQGFQVLNLSSHNGIPMIVVD